jgi:ParB-like chromosome segregation protein Spo0J
MTTTILEKMNDEDEKVHHIPIDKIELDRTWNTRKYLGDDDDGPEEHTFGQLVTSLECDGQDTPVDVKPGSDGHYFLIAGFRRFVAFQRLYSESKSVKGVRPGCIKAFIREGLTEVEALVRNGRENTGRTNLNPADTALLIHRLSEHRLTEADIAKRLAITPSYVNQLHTIHRGTSNLRITHNGKDVSVFDHWRDAPGRVGLQSLLELARSKTEPNIKESKYLELLSVDKGDRGKTKAVIQRNDIKAAELFGLMMGRMSKTGAITINTPNWKALLELGKRMDFKSSAPDYIERVTKSASDAYERTK